MTHARTVHEGRRWRRMLRSSAPARLVLLTVFAAFVVAAVVPTSASAANTSWIGAPVYSNPWDPSHTYTNSIPAYTGVNMYCWLDASWYTSAVNGSTNRWLYVRWWAVYHWLYG